MSANHRALTRPREHQQVMHGLGPEDQESFLMSDRSKLRGLLVKILERCLMSLYLKQ